MRCGVRNVRAVSCELEATSCVSWQHVKPIYFDMKHINLNLIHVVLFLCAAHKVEAEVKGVKSFSWPRNPISTFVLCCILIICIVVSLVGSARLEIPSK